jgi:hypothetical protein
MPPEFIEANMFQTPRLKLPTLLQVLTLLGVGLSLQACGVLQHDRGTGQAPPIVTSPPAPGQAPSTAPSAPSAKPDAHRPETVRPSPAPRPGEPSAARPTPPSSVPAPIADRKIDLQGSCTQTEEDGYREQATLTVRDNQVQSMSWQLWVGKKGTCKFDVADFVQTKARPSIEMASRDGNACKLVIYQDPRRVTLGFANCQKHCTGNIYDEAYPVMFDPKTGACADLGR